MTKLPQPLDSPKNRAARMRQLRHSFGLTQVAFCRRYGFTVPQWSNFENGKPVGWAAAQRLFAQIPGLSYDWIYRGSIEGLSIAMARRLGALPPERPSKRAG